MLQRVLRTLAGLVIDVGVRPGSLGPLLLMLGQMFGKDALDPPGVYVGTQGGQILASRDGGDRWAVIFNWLPPIYSLEAAAVEQ